MTELLLNRTTIIGLAVVGGVFSVLASWCLSRSLITEQKAVWLNRIAYAFMAVSMALFIGVGIFGSGKQA